MTSPEPQPQPQPHFGFSRHHGFPVHARTISHLAPQAGESRAARLNKRVAVWMFTHVGSMPAFWVTLLLCLCALPAVLYQMSIISLKTTVTGYGFYLALTWAISTTFQAVMLPGLMVGQNIQNSAADARAAKQFEDTEVIADRLDEHTQGGITEILDRLAALEKRLPPPAEGGTGT
jgi:uncharacterized membrane protein YqaE (UPF0057 family)